MNRLERARDSLRMQSFGGTTRGQRRNLCVLLVAPFLRARCAVRFQRGHIGIGLLDSLAPYHHNLKPPVSPIPHAYTLSRRCLRSTRMSCRSIRPIYIQTGQSQADSREELTRSDPSRFLVFTRRCRVTYLAFGAFSIVSCNFPVMKV